MREAEKRQSILSLAAFLYYGFFLIFGIGLLGMVLQNMGQIPAGILIAMLAIVIVLAYFAMNLLRTKGKQKNLDEWASELEKRYGKGFVIVNRADIDLADDEVSTNFNKILFEAAKPNYQAIWLGKGMLDIVWLDDSKEKKLSISEKQVTEIMDYGSNITIRAKREEKDPGIEGRLFGAPRYDTELLIPTDTENYQEFYGLMRHYYGKKIRRN